MEESEFFKIKDDDDDDYTYFCSFFGLMVFGPLVVNLFSVTEGRLSTLGQTGPNTDSSLA